MTTTDFNTDSTYLSLRGKLADHFTEFNRIWTVYGYKTEKIAQRKRTIEKFFDDLFSDMIGEERKRLTEKRQELDNIIAEAHRLVKELELSAQEDPMKTIQGKGTATLMEEEVMLHEIISDLRKRKEVRMERYNEINKNVEELIVVLGEEPYLLQFDGIPTDAQVDELNRHLITLRQEERSRVDKYKKLAVKIKEHFVHLEKFPCNKLERIIITGQPSEMPAPLSVSVMKEITDLESTLNSEIERNRQEAESLWQKIRDLWKRLKTDEDIINAFEATHQWTTPGPQVNKRKSRAVVLIAKPSLITGLRSELHRLEEEKKENIASFIQELRDELTQLWDSCLTLTEEGEQYSRSTYMGIGFTLIDFNSDDYSEELLEKHEKEVEKWRLYAGQEHKLIDGVNRRREMWTRWLGLEFRSDDPARLFNRGGALLKEEKERKTLAKQIPKLEKDLKKLSIDHGEKYGVKFMAYGEEISSQIDREWSEFEEEKEARKNARKKPVGENEKTMAMTSVAASPGSRKRQAPQTPSNAIGKPGGTPKKGRMVAATPKTPFCPPISSKLPASANPERFLTPKPPAPLKATGPVKKRKSLRLQNKEQIAGKPNSGKKNLVSPSSTYSEFSKDVLQSGLNSSVAPNALVLSREPLSNLGGTTTPKTPVRNRLPQPKTTTPAKSTMPYKK